MTAYNRKTLLLGAAIALAVGGIVSYFASGAPDGLEKAQEDLGMAEPAHAGLDAPPVVFEEYSLKGLGSGFWGNAAAGVVGSLLVLAVLLLVGYLLKRRKRPSPETDAA
ncbi:MAG TPA: PDGLE domain-containing protein [Phycisphaerae bacterium]|nr:PDGLE domain-containing protein [Phycisphaerae bacterium]